MVALTVVLAVLAAVAVDWLTADAGLLPPGFRPEREGGVVRRSVAVTLLAIVLWIGVFGPLAVIGADTPEPTEPVSPGGLFLLHGFFLAFVLAWLALGFPMMRPVRSAVEQLGFATRDLPRELGLGVVAGVLAWLLVVGVVMLVGGLFVALGEEDLLPQQAPGVVTVVAALPLALRVAISLSAGVFEELFFRGYLQPRAGVAISTAFFVLAHASYEQPFMLIGVTLLSLVFAGLTWWRRNIWPAIVAHAVFDAIQLLFVVPWALEWLESGGP